MISPVTRVMLCLAMTVGSAMVAMADPPVLHVPSTAASLYLATELPQNFKGTASGSQQLVNTAEPDVKIRAQLIAAVAADGTRGDPQGRLVAVIRPPKSVGPRTFTLLPETGSKQEARFEWKQLNDKSLGLYEQDKPVLTYNFGMITNAKVPKRDVRRSRSCYVHPVWGLNGEILTDDFPKDHYHHHGIFWAWSHVQIEGKEYDLWLGQGIRQQFVRWLDRQAGPLCAVLGVENGWFVGERKVMIERVWLRTYRQAEGHRVLDVDLTLIPVEKAITLRGAEEKSYGGLTMRFAPAARKDKLITVPSGPTKDDLPDTPLAWADFTGKFPGAPTPSGAAIFVDPRHPNFPPTWLTRYYGALCVGWPGVHSRALPPERPVRLSYRLWIHKTAVDLSQLQAADDAYAAGERAAWQ